MCLLLDLVANASEARRFLPSCYLVARMCKLNEEREWEAQMRFRCDLCLCSELLTTGVQYEII